MRLLLLILTSLTLGTADAREPDDPPPDARELVRKAMDHWRGVSSYSEMTMTIHRPGWERTMSMRSWSKGDDLTLVRVTEPRKDAGNGTLLDGDNMWTYSPRINRIVKIPSAMMAQSWMGSDFSNRDIAKSTDIIDEYDHQLTRREQHGDRVHYTISSIPHENAPVVWGEEVLIVRDDYVLMRHEFRDQDGEMVKVMKTLETDIMGGRPVAKIMRMSAVDTPEEWTELRVIAVDFDRDLPDRLFTLSNLRNPRQ
ncbi:MAG: outer membrane lipoprotein-sorting protein [Xanthomonadales bacterium]|nr:outer membrane lipoprotein-sorting protein [Xanthomonadales bacterium]